ncbi:MAG TPA: KamA family radical SAM protein [Polyangiales bacterium]|nr:KamA family radical SAM protein [Polyangiales bacterium]
MSLPLFDDEKTGQWMRGDSLDVAGARSDADLDGRWRREVRQAVTTLEGLEEALTLSAAEREGVKRALAGGFPLAITPYYLSLCDPEDPSCPVRIQCVPNIEEASERRGDLRDPLGEEDHEVAKHLVQRYPDRALLLVTDRCSVYCRFCTRSRMVGAGGGVRSARELAPAFEYLRTHPEIRDVIVSGGDPLVMSDARIEGLLRELAAIDHVLTVRIASRTPVTLPHRITDSLCRALRTHPAPWLMTHFNHPKELTPLAREACARLADHGIPVMNQTVLLRGVNDDVATLDALFRGLVRTRVRPYYLLQADPVRGTSHLRTPLSKGIELIGQLQGRLTGIALPKFIVDTPGGKGKVPIGPEVIVRREGPNTTLRTFRGELVDYVDPDHA